MVRFWSTVRTRGQRDRGDVRRPGLVDELGLGASRRCRSGGQPRPPAPTVAPIRCRCDRCGRRWPLPASSGRSRLTGVLVAGPVVAPGSVGDAAAVTAGRCGRRRGCRRPVGSSCPWCGGAAVVGAVVRGVAGAAVAGDRRRSCSDRPTVVGRWSAARRPGCCSWPATGTASYRESWRPGRTRPGRGSWAAASSPGSGPSAGRRRGSS